MFYYLYKQGVYGHGVFWVGTDVGEGKRVADRAASLDRDDYHDWGLFEYSEPTSDTVYEEFPGHKLIYTGERSQTD